MWFSVRFKLFFGPSERIEIHIKSIYWTAVLVTILLGRIHPNYCFRNSEALTIKKKPNWVNLVRIAREKQTKRCLEHAPIIANVSSSVYYFG